jgi:uncharacterized damage-inducible protein DinB
MQTQNTQAQQLTQAVVITPEALLEHWQGHRRVTRRMIEAFPEEAFFSYSLGGMRPFANLVMEMIHMAAPGIKGVVTGQWQGLEEIAVPQTKQDVLLLWDEVTEQLNTLWPQIQPNRFGKVEAAFGLYEQPIILTILYFIDNEIHHRGQAYVYLRTLGIEPPPFWDRR